MLVADVLTTIFAFSLVRKNWNKMEKRIYIGTTIVKCAASILEILFSTMSVADSSSNTYAASQYLTLPLALAWGACYVFFSIECIYFGTFPQKEKESDEDEKEKPFVRILVVH